MLYKGIRFPLEKSTSGFLLDLTIQDSDVVKSNLIYLLTTQKGERRYKPDFGTNILKYLFEPATDSTADKIKGEITDAVVKYMPSVTIDSVQIIYDDNNRRLVGLKLFISYNKGIIKQSEDVDVFF